jgi:Holliday junction resolvasome RuvABC endonuclease subunit
MRKARKEGTGTGKGKGGVLVQLPALTDYERIFSVDPGMHSPGWCLLSMHEEVLQHGSLKITGTGEDALARLGAAVRNLYADLSVGGQPFPSLMVIEKQYAPQHRKTGDGQVTAKGMGESVHLVGLSAGVWIGVVPCRAIVRVLPSVWGAAWGIGHAMKTDARKEHSLALARSLFPSLEWNKDSSDALLMGLWAVREIKTQRLTQE